MKVVGAVRKVVLSVALVTALVVPLGALAASTSGQSTSTAMQGNAENIRVVMVGGSLSDPFWSTLVRGARDAASGLKAQGISFEFLGPKDYSNIQQDVVTLNQTALARRPNVVVAWNVIPPAQTPGLKKIVAAGIPLIEVNGGATTWRGDGALRYVGTDETLAGRAAGQALAKAGVKHLLFANISPGSPPMEMRWSGLNRAMKAAGGKATVLNLPLSTFGDPASVTQAIKGSLLKDKSIDGVMAAAANTADNAYLAIKQAGKTKSVTLGTFDMSVNSLNRIIGGGQLLAVDQQPYLQGYQAVTMAFQYVKWGILPADPWFRTGPLLVTKSNAAKALAATKLGVRGAS